MQFGSLFERFLQASPIPVMYRALLERALDPQQLDQLFHDTAQTQRTRERLFSAMVQLMFAVVSKAHPSVRAASFASLDEVMTTLTAVSAKLQGIKPEVCRGFVLHAHDRLEPILRRLDGGTLPRPLPGYRARILDGNHLAGTEHRPAPTRTTRVAALPGQTLVVLDPATMLACDVVPCGDAYAQERSLIDAVLERVAEGDFWIADRNFCCSRSVFGVVARRGHFLVRQHKATLRWEEAGVGGDGRCAEVGDDLPHALDAGERLPDADRGVALRDRHVGLAQGGVVRVLHGVGGLQRGGGGASGVAGGAWGRAGGGEGLELLPGRGGRQYLWGDDDRPAAAGVGGVSEGRRGGVRGILAGDGGVGLAGEVSAEPSRPEEASSGTSQRQEEPSSLNRPIVAGLVSRAGPHVEVLNGVSLHGGLVASWPRGESVTAKFVGVCLVEPWRQFGLPRSAQFDKDTILQGTHAHPDAVRRVSRLRLSLGVVPVFVSPREPGFQAAIEEDHGFWQARVWARFEHADWDRLINRSSRHVAALRRHRADRIESAPPRRAVPKRWHLDLQAPLRGRIISLRRTDASGRAEVLGRSVEVDVRRVHRLVRAEVDLKAGMIRFYRLRRREPGDQPLIREVTHRIKNKLFHE